MNINIENLHISTLVKLERRAHYILQTEDFLSNKAKDRLIRRLQERTGCYFEILDGGIKIALAQNSS